MDHVHFSEPLDVLPGSGRDVVRNFGSLPVWFPLAKQSVLSGGDPYEIGTIRANTAEDGSTIEERLLELSDRDRRVVYDIVAADIPTKNYSATLRIYEMTTDPGSCFIEWSADFDVEGDAERAISRYGTVSLKPVRKSWSG